LRRLELLEFVSGSQSVQAVMLRRDRPSIVPANMREGRKRDAIVTVTRVGFLKLGDQIW
jgi:hypothetical protein